MKDNSPDVSCVQTCIIGQALDGMCVGLVLTNAAGRVAWMNRTAFRVLGLEKREAYGRLLSHVIRDPQLGTFWHEAKESDRSVLGDVSVRWPRSADLKVNATTCLDVDGERIGRALLFCDVTSERALQIKLSEDATKRLLDMANHFQGARDAEPHAGLTQQELRVLRLVGEGLGNQEIARKMHVASSTVRSHLKHIYQKLGLTSRPEVISYAIRNSLV